MSSNKWLNDIWSSNNYEVNNYLRNIKTEGERFLDNDEIKKVVDYVDKKFKTQKLEEGTFYRGIGFKSKKELDDFIDRNIIFSDGKYKDKGFAFTQRNEVADVYVGKYGVILKYKQTKALSNSIFFKGQSNVFLINRNKQFKVSSVKKKGEIYEIELE